MLDLVSVVYIFFKNKLVFLGVAFAFLGLDENGWSVNIKNAFDHGGTEGPEEFTLLEVKEENDLLTDDKVVLT